MGTKISRLGGSAPPVQGSRSGALSTRIDERVQAFLSRPIEGA